MAMTEEPSEISKQLVSANLSLSAHNILQSALCSVHTISYTVYTISYGAHIISYNVYTISYNVYTKFSKVYTIFYKVHTIFQTEVHCAHNILNTTIQSMFIWAKHYTCCIHNVPGTGCTHHLLCSAACTCVYACVSSFMHTCL